jgi:hypothetical protein
MPYPLTGAYLFPAAEAPGFPDGQRWPAKVEFLRGMVRRNSDLYFY